MACPPPPLSPSQLCSRCKSGSFVRRGKQGRRGALPLLHTVLVPSQNTALCRLEYEGRVLQVSS